MSYLATPDDTTNRVIMRWCHDAPVDTDVAAQPARVDVLVVTWNTAHVTAQALRRLLDS